MAFTFLNNVNKTLFLTLLSGLVMHAVIYFPFLLALFDRTAQGDKGVKQGLEPITVKSECSMYLAAAFTTPLLTAPIL